MTRGIWCFVVIAFLLMLCAPWRAGSQEYPGGAEVYDRSVGGLTLSGLEAPPIEIPLEAAHREFLGMVRRFATAWNQWRRAHNDMLKATALREEDRERERDLWKRTAEEGAGLRASAFAQRELSDLNEIVPRTIRRKEFNCAAMDFSVSWYQWVSLHAKRLRGKSAPIGWEASVFQEMADRLARLDELKRGPTVPSTPPPAVRKPHGSPTQAPGG